MPKPNAIVSRRVRLEGGPERESTLARAEGGLSVALDDGQRVRLDPENPRSPGFAQVLDGLEKLGRPAYLEVDPETAAVTRLLLPLVGRVVAMHETGPGYEVEFAPSQARHLLRRDDPDFPEIESQLREALRSKAPVILTEDDSHDILDIRFFKPGPDDGPLVPDFDFPSVRRNWFLERLFQIWYWPIWPWWWWRRGCISRARAQQVFDAMGATTCNPLTVPPPCIPFLYPDNGCWARAHEMCRLMINLGLSPRKVWIQGQLHAPTRNRPDCFVNWGWHVAPTLCVRQRWFWTARMVIDPSLVTTPVSEAGWKGVQGDPNASLTGTAASQYYLGGGTDPNYTQTDIDLAFYRLQLLNRSNQIGPPPYANCP